MADNATTEVMRLTKEQYAQLVKQLPGSVAVTAETTPMQAGYMLGVQTVLKLLREGYVIGDAR